MNAYKLLRRLLGALSLTAALASAADPAPVPTFKQGDTVCFIGDSITRGGLFHRNLVLFYATRFPQARFESFNCGISGDKAAGVLQRFDYDVAVHRPTVATLMLGMNDIGGAPFGKDRDGEQAPAKLQALLATYTRDMESIAQKLQAQGAKTIFITPSIYDETGNQATAAQVGRNDVLAKCSDIVRTLAAKYAGSVVDFNAPMAQLNAAQQAKDPAFTLIGKDRIHPGETGHLVMTYLFLKAQGMSGVVATVDIDAPRAQVVTAERCTVSDLQRDPTGALRFTYLAQSLPFPLPAEARQAAELVPFTAELNRELVRVQGLNPGSYEIVIDDQVVQTVTAAELQQGVNLAANPKTPQYKQALAVKAQNDRQYTQSANRLRILQATRHFTLSKVPGLKIDDVAGCIKHVEAELEKAIAQKREYQIWQYKTYLSARPQQAEIEQEVRAAYDEMWRLNTPKPHRYIIRPAASAPVEAVKPQPSIS